MQAQIFSDFELDIARTRVALSLLAMLSVYVDPTIAGGLFHLSAYVLATLACHLVYSIVTCLLLKYRLAARRLPIVTTTLDVFFAMAVAYLTEGTTPNIAGHGNPVGQRFQGPWPCHSHQQSRTYCPVDFATWF